MATTTIDGATQIADGSIPDAKISATAAIATTKLADGAEFVKRNGSVAATADWNLGGFKITNLGTPTLPGDAATKAYVDSTAEGLDVKKSVRVATTAALPANTRTGNVLTASANGAMPNIDGVVMALNDRVLVKDEATGANNGLYTVTDLGSATTPWKLTRATDADTDAKVTPGLFTWVEEGTINGDSGWVLTTNAPITLNTTALSFTQFSGAGQITAGMGLTKTGNTLDVGAGDGIEVLADSVTVKIDGTTLAKSPVGLKVAAGGITATEIAAGTITNAQISNTAAITYGKLNLAGSIVNADIAPTAAIAYSKLSLGGSIVNADISPTAAIAYSKLALTGSIVNADIAPAAAIAYSKLALANSIVNADISATAAIANTKLAMTFPRDKFIGNGVTTTFTLTATPYSNSLAVYKNGLLQNDGIGNDYTVSGATITFATAPANGAVIICMYTA